MRGDVFSVPIPYNTAMTFPYSSKAQVVLPPAVAGLTAGVLARTLTPISAEASLGTAAFQMSKQQVTALPVILGTQGVGWLRHDRLADLLLDLEGDADSVPVGTVMDPLPLAITPETPLSELVALFHATGAPLLPVISYDGGYVGCVSWADVLAAQAGRVTPARIGGMATPLGVYLTNGVVSGGAGSLGLVLTGMQMALLFWLVTAGYVLLSAALYHWTSITFFLDAYHQLIGDPLHRAPSLELLLSLVVYLLLMGTFLLLLRIGPLLAGYHAAEHMTVHAVEAGEPLTPEAVGRMSRVHPRCGTNLWAIVALAYAGLNLLALALLSSWGKAYTVPIVTLALYGGAIILLIWRPVGAWLQEYCTTRPPSPREVASGIHAGRQLMDRYLRTPGLHPTRLQRIWNMGLLQVGVGIVLMGFFLSLLEPRLYVLWQSLVK